MNRPHSAIYLVAGSALTLVIMASATSCANQPGTSAPVAPSAQTVTMTAEKGLLAMRGLEAIGCNGVADMHAAAVLTGADFNKAKATCDQVDAQLNNGDAILKGTQTGDVVAIINAVQVEIATLPAKK